jgi:hypothetical protein
MPNMNKDDQPIVEIRVRAGYINRYTVLLQNGIDVRTPFPCTIGDLMDRLPGFTPDYINNRVQTIFLNGSAMDNLATPISGKNPVLAISAAMPGLAGAIFRRNSIHAALRSKAASSSGENGSKEMLTVKLKLFNMIATERGEALLAQGVGIAGDILAAFLTDHPTLLSSIVNVRISEKEVNSADLVQRLQKAGNIFLTIKKDDDELSS